MIHAPGIYENLSEAEYLADESLGSSALKRLLKSPLDYWTYSPHNPKRPRERTSRAMDLGTAMHVRILLGRQAFEQRYAPALDRSQFPDHLDSVKELAQRCAELGVARSGTKAELVERIRKADPETRLFANIEERHAQGIGRREQLPADEIDRIEQAVLAIQQSTEARDRVFGGKPEVSLFWRDPATGTPLKSRVDSLKYHERQAIDLKSYSNPFGRDINKTIGRAISNFRYDIQARLYLEGLKHLTGDTHTFTFVFVETGWAPNVRLIEFGPQLRFRDSMPSPIWSKAERDFRHAVGLWAFWSRRVGMDVPWVDPALVTELDPEDMPYEAYDHEEEEMFV